MTCNLTNIELLEFESEHPKNKFNERRQVKSNYDDERNSPQKTNPFTFIINTVKKDKLMVWKQKVDKKFVFVFTEISRISQNKC